MNVSSCYLSSDCLRTSYTIIAFLGADPCGIFNQLVAGYLFSAVCQHVLFRYLFKIVLYE